jgi:hypothetical protein
VKKIIPLFLAVALATGCSSVTKGTAYIQFNNPSSHRAQATVCGTARAVMEPNTGTPVQKIRCDMPSDGPLAPNEGYVSVFVHDLVTNTSTPVLTCRVGKNILTMIEYDYRQDSFQGQGVAKCNAILPNGTDGSWVFGGGGTLSLSNTVLKQDPFVLTQDTTVLRQDSTVLRQDTMVLRQDKTVLRLDTTVLSTNKNLVLTQNGFITTTKKKPKKGH